MRTIFILVGLGVAGIGYFMWSETAEADREAMIELAKDEVVQATAEVADEVIDDVSAATKESLDEAVDVASARAKEKLREKLKEKL